jgi:hypothetical protein
MSNKEYMEDIREEDEFVGSEDVAELDPTVNNYMFLVKSKKDKKRRKPPMFGIILIPFLVVVTQIIN